MARHFDQAIALAISAFLLFPVSGAAYAAQNAGQNTGKPAAAAGAPAQGADPAQQKQKTTEAARRNYDNGVKSFQAGKLQPAIDDLSAALRIGGLPAPDLARAMYIRGLAYKKQNKPGLAISDLTSALWLKNGLSESERLSATSERAEAYRSAGLGEGNSGAEKVAVADPNQAQSPAGATPAPAAPAAAQSKQPAKASKTKSKTPTVAAAAPLAPAPEPVREITRQSPDSEAAKEAAQARKLAQVPVETGGIQDAVAARWNGANSPASSAVAASVPAPAPVPVAEAQAAFAAPSSTPAVPPAATFVEAAPQQAAAQALSPPTPTSSVKSLFSSLFGGDSKPANAPVLPQATQSVETASTASQAAVDAASGPPSSVAPVKVAAAANAPATAAAAAPAPPKGKYKVHIAAVRTRAEAEALAQKVMAQSGAALKNHVAQVDESVIGSMGTFYRVRVPGYANSEEPRAVCGVLRASGFDCLVVTN